MRLGSLLCLLAVACGGGDKTSTGAAASTPEEAFRAYVQASKDGNPEAAWALHSANLQGGMQAMLDDMRSLPEAEFQAQFGIPRKEIEGLSTRDAFMKLGRSETVKAQGRQRVIPAIDRVEGSGKEATVYFTEDGGACRVRMVEEGGGWKVDGLVACKKASN